MSTNALPIETAERDLRGVLEELDLADTVTLSGSESVLQALLVSLGPAPRKAPAESDWEARRDMLAQQVSEAWRIEKSAVELLSEMSR